MMARKLTKSANQNADVTVRFDYSQVPAEYRDELESDAIAIRGDLIQAANSMIDAGWRLSRWRERLPHGAWLPWVVAEARMSPQKARDAINVYKRFRDSPTLLNDLELALPQTAIVRLATAPDTAFEDVIDRITAGETLLEADVSEIVKHHRRFAKEEAAAAEGKPKPEPAMPTAAEGLRTLAYRARDELVPLIIARLKDVLFVLEDYETQKPSKKKLEGKLRSHAQWLTDALEQLTQRSAISGTSLVHRTLVDRQPHEPGPWAEAATFLRDISHSIAWEKIDAADVPELVRRGRDCLQAVLSPDERRSFFRMQF